MWNDNLNWLTKYGKKQDLGGGKHELRYGAGRNNGPAQQDLLFSMTCTFAIQKIKN